MWCAFARIVLQTCITAGVLPSVLNGGIGVAKARVIIGGYDQDLSVEVTDSFGRAVRDAVLPWLAQGKGLFLTYTRDDGRSKAASTVWVGPSSSIRFEFEGEVPFPNPSATEMLEDRLFEYGGFILS